MNTTLDFVITLFAIPVSSALINLLVAKIGAADSTLGGVASTLGTDLKAFFALVFAKKEGK